MMNRNRTVYLVDSDTSARRGLKNYLAAVGYKVKAFASYRDFLKIDTINKHACLILDAHTSELSVKASQAEFLQKTADLPIIFIAADDDRGFRKNALAVKALNFFHNPVDGPALLDAIGWVLETNEEHTT